MTPQEVIENNLVEAMPIPHNGRVWSNLSKKWFDARGQPIYS